jgi:predicted DnaQ family exonuclease/DinG family helicase
MLLTPEILQAIGYNDFVVLDLETTGLDPTTDKIIEIGAIRFKDGLESEIFSTLINPGVEIPDFINKLTGITNEDVQMAPTLDEQIDPLLSFLVDSTLIGHQVNFDTSFIEYQLRVRANDYSDWQNEAQRFKYLQNKRSDTLFLARIFFPFLPRLNLSSVSAYFNIDLEKAHRALDDARATGQIFLQLMERTLACNEKILRMIIRLLYRNSSRVKNYFQPILDYKIKNKIEITAGSLSEDLIYNQKFYNIIGENDYLLKPEKDEKAWRTIDSREISAYFSSGGQLQRAIDKFEQREPQIEMAQKVTEAFNLSRFLVVEAGTGIGKSMAYLLPAVSWAVANRAKHARIIISTNTKNLQEQLFFKDIPTVFACTPEKFKAVMLKGKSNYLCLDKWHATLTDMDHRLSNQERTRLLPLIVWAEQTQTGDIAENNGFQVNQNWGLWTKLIAENNYCPGRTCRHYKECFLIKARNNARASDLVIVNHSLLFSDLVTDNSILGDFANLVIDEAHHLEKTAGEYLGIRFNWWTFRNIYHKIYEEEPKKAGILVQLEYRLSKSTAAGPFQTALNNHSNRLKSECISLKQLVYQFFSQLNTKLREKYQNAQQEETKIRYHQNFRFFSELQLMIADIEDNLRNCKKRLSDLLNIYHELRADSFEFQDQLHRDLISCETDLITLYESFRFCIRAESNEHVYWLELPLRKESTDVLFNAVPLNIAELLNQTLYKNLHTVVMTSATISVNGSFDYFISRSGLKLDPEREIDSALLGSPFEYQKQLLLCIPDFIDDPRNERFSEQISDIIKEVHDRHATGMLVLFTNYSMLNFLYQDLKLHFNSKHVLLLAQGKSGSRNMMINQFREYRDSVLFGTDSFWEGIDVPGEALELLLITKLPFDVPTEPLIAARLEKIKQEGGNPFFDYSVPEAIIKFRQGFGRLIRHKQDFGAVIVCDNRLVRMQYGQQFINSLPVRAQIFKDKTSLFQTLELWFKNKKV